MTNIKKICYFGDFDLNYIRGSVILEGLRQNNIELLICNEHGKGFKKYLRLIKCHRKIKNNYDLMIVGNGDHTYFMVILSFFLSRKPIVWDLHYSIYDTYVYDRRLVRKNSLKAAYYWFLEWVAIMISDRVLLDTNDHIKYIAKTFKQKPEKFIRSLVGANNKDMYPIDHEKEHEGFLVQFHGKFIPLQGIEYIVKAAKLLEVCEDIKFQIIGKGQTYKDIMMLVDEIKSTNIEFINRVSYEDLRGYINKGDVCLGIFGNTGKASRVIANKIYESFAIGKPVITGSTPAIKEVFTNRKNILLCNMADPDDLADKILKLRNNTELRKKIAENGHCFYQEKLVPKKIGEQLLYNLKKI